MIYWASLLMFLLAVFFSLIIFFVYKKFQVRIDPRLGKMIPLLPGLNCGACGFASCENLAEAILKNQDAICPVLGPEKMKPVYRIAGREGKKGNVIKAVVLCGARSEDKIFYAQYKGIETCRAANINSSYQACSFGCLGFGDCVQVCPASAIEIKNGRAEVDATKCIGCGLCVKECPRGIIKLLPYEVEYLPFVACSNKDKAGEVKSVCKVGCIGCGLCVKLGPEGGFVLENNLARVNLEKIKEYNKEELWRKALDKCPRGIIKMSYIQVEEKV